MASSSHIALGTTADFDAAAHGESFELVARAAAAAEARAHVRRLLDGWRLGGDACDAAQLVISELVTNAVLHASGGRIVCRLALRPPGVRLEVRDQGGSYGVPIHTVAGPEDECGRGLGLVAALSEAWGTEPSGPGFAVWATLRAPRPV
ncbi:ATP-binding protein [Streptomyces sp. CMB-StM0423]|uniref:ATP-binding protein n=1 Tax=Streptomyces sp. CMB-StM0423 TaxID=2059884 RepID=UPI000C704F90|nr:ATP-binding protein [Streptomyces sp. CMB-StM0423]AUH40589.1 ATP-binding protein [Streptomyces sp. CMB-StM0423]